MEEKVLIKTSSKQRLAIGTTVFGALCIFIPLLVCAIISGDSGMIGWLIRYAFHGYIYPIVLGVILLRLGISALCCQLTVTDKRVYGTAAIRRRVDLPIRSISAVGFAPFSTITVSTSSGVIKFCMVEDRKKVYNVITELLDKQSMSAAQPVVVGAPVASNSDADDIAKFKKLLDDGAITQEEYDTKKKQLLGL